MERKLNVNKFCLSLYDTDTITWYHYIQLLYPDFVGPEYIIVTNDADIVKKHPKTAGMIIVPISKFESMAEEYNRYYANEVKHIRRMFLISQYFRFFFFQSHILPNCVIPYHY